MGDQLGGTLTLIPQVENYPGFQKISGQELAKRLADQAQSLGGEIKVAGITEISRQGSIFSVKTKDGETLTAKTLLMATGMERRKLEVPGEVEYLGRGVSYCTTCLPPGEEVVANDSLVKIDDIGIAERVLTADGTFRHISQIMSRNYKGEIVKIKTRFFTEPVKLTSNHLVLATRVTKNYYQKMVTIDKPRWVPAGSLTLQDSLLYPVINEIKDREKIQFSELLGVNVEGGMARNNQETHSSHRISDTIPVEEEFLRLVGYFLAEGCVARHGISFYFNKKEKEYIKDITKITKKLFSLKPFLKTEGSVTRIEVSSKLLRDLFQILFGKCAPQKRIPHWMLFLPLEKQKEIIKGFYRGDGCLRDKDFCFVTTSRTLAYQLRDILLRFGVIPSVVKREKTKLNKLPSEIGRRKIRFTTDKYHLVIGGTSLEKISRILKVHHSEIERRKTTNYHAWIEKDYLYLPIREIEKEYYQGKVYNLAVEDNNTYVAKNFIVHNCDAAFFKGKSVAVIGGSNAAVMGAIHLAEFGRRVYVLYRGEKLRAEPIWIERLLANSKIEVIYQTNIAEILGDGKKVTGAKLDKPYQGKVQIDLDGIFIEVGGIPGTALVKSLGVALDEKGFIKVAPDMVTNVPGLFAAGDIASVFGEMQQIVVAVAEGSLAALSVFQYLKGQVEKNG